MNKWTKDEEVFRIGALAEKAQVSARTIRYYESLGLLGKPKRSRGEQRIYTQKDLVYLFRIIELKNYGLSLEHIKEIVDLGKSDPTGEKRRLALLMRYREKLSTAFEHKKGIETLIEALSRHISQLESPMNFSQCPGAECPSCLYAEGCRFREIPHGEGPGEEEETP